MKSAKWEYYINGKNFLKSMLESKIYDSCALRVVSLKLFILLFFGCQYEYKVFLLKETFSQGNIHVVVWKKEFLSFYLTSKILQ